jgi:hypothetical protein
VQGETILCRDLGEDAPAVCGCAEKVVQLDTMGEWCAVERLCGAMIGVDCESAVDGPYDYYDEKGRALAECGGRCMGQACQNCPPRGWTCDTY